MTQPHARDDRPVVFISYAWKPEANKQWVKTLAQELRENGVDVQLDQFHLKPGHDAQFFMEQMVTREAVRKVLLVCTREYKRKADRREGGAGNEAQIISPELANKVDQTKFVALVRERDENGRAFTPAFLGSPRYIDFSADDAYDASFEELVRDIFDKPASPPPPLGKPPSYVTDDAPTLATAGRSKAIERAFKQGTATVGGLLADYADAFIESVEQARLTPDQGQQADFDQAVVDSIHRLRLYRDDFLGVLASIARFSDAGKHVEFVHDFLERTLTLRGRREGVHQWRDAWYENFDFLCRDLFLCSVALLARSGRPEIAASLMSESYYSIKQGDHEGSVRSFIVFDTYFRGLDEHRKNRLKSNRTSPAADLMRECTPAQHFSFEAYKETDFLLYMRSLVDLGSGSEEQSGRWSRRDRMWYPATRPYMEHGNRFEMFDRAQQARNRDVMLKLLGASSKSQLLERMQLGGKRLDGWFEEHGMGRFAASLVSKWPS
jgi:hypothetical protein